MKIRRGKNNNNRNGLLLAGLGSVAAIYLFRNRGHLGKILDPFKGIADYFTKSTDGTDVSASGHAEPDVKTPEIQPEF